MTQTSSLITRIEATNRQAPSLEMVEQLLNAIRTKTRRGVQARHIWKVGLHASSRTTPTIKGHYGFASRGIHDIVPDLAG